MGRATALPSALMVTRAQVWSLAPVAWATALWPVLIIHLAYFNSAAGGHLPWCWPYWDGCTSISAAARSGNSIYLFRATMMPWAGLLAVYCWPYWDGCTSISAEIGRAHV